MDIIELPSAEPRIPPCPFQQFIYPVSATNYLPVPEQDQSVSFFEVLGQRTTRREFGSINQEDLSNLLWHSAKVKSTKCLDAGHTWQHRPAPSAGGRHPIDLLIITSTEQQLRMQVYDPTSHSLGDLPLSSSGPIQDFYEFLRSNFEIGEATIVWFAAQAQKTASAYRNAASLIYRDVGALEATMALVAEAFGLNHCSIGITGEPWISKYFHSEGLVLGVGGIFIGRALATLDR